MMIKEYKKIRIKKIYMCKNQSESKDKNCFSFFRMRLHIRFLLLALCVTFVEIDHK